LRVKKTGDTKTSALSAVFFILKALGRENDLKRNDLNKFFLGAGSGQYQRAASANSVARGLYALGLNSYRVSHDDYLRPLIAPHQGDENHETTEQNKGGTKFPANYCLLRVEIKGSDPAWGLIDGIDAETGKFRLLMPSSGKIYLVSEAALHRLGVFEGAGCFAIPDDPLAHDQDVNRNDGGFEEEQRKENSYPPTSLFGADLRAPHEITLEEWCGGREVIPPAKFGDFHRRSIRAAEEMICSAAKSSRLEILPWKSAKFPDITFGAVKSAAGYSGMDRLVAFEGDRGPDMVVIGGLAGGTTWVNESRRNRGLGAELLLAAYGSEGFRFTGATSFSVDGYRARLSAHRKAVACAIAQGLAIPEDVSVQYKLGDDGILALAESRWDEVWQEALAAGESCFSPGHRMRQYSAAPPRDAKGGKSGSSERYERSSERYESLGSDRSLGNTASWESYKPLPRSSGIFERGGEPIPDFTTSRPSGVDSASIDWPLTSKPKTASELVDLEGFKLSLDRGMRGDVISVRTVERRMSWTASMPNYVMLERENRLVSLSRPPRDIPDQLMEEIRDFSIAVNSARHSERQSGRAPLEAEAVSSGNNAIDDKGVDSVIRNDGQLDLF
jgi:hypothetical protein